ncbi:retropepsin-like domain-containing protein [Candidatus Woesebacteria bacterium]|nr:retropepsin-like domain-containing protein [Candidatus Woesebacteria bacterium]
MFTFPYQYTESEYGRVFNPLINIPIKTNIGWQNLWFLLDSGADTTMLTTSLATEFGLAYDKNSPIKLYGIGENSITAYSGTVIMKLGDYDIKVRVNFSSEHESTLLLGRLDIFDTFDIAFQTTTRQIIFKQLKNV